MATLTIRKKSAFTWLHTDSDFGDFILSDFYFNVDGTHFQIIDKGLSRRRKYTITDIFLYDDVLATGVETFASFTALSLRLEALEYIGFDFTKYGFDPTANHFKGNYDVLTNTPPLTDSSGILNDEYICTTAGSRNFGSGVVVVGVNDIISFDGVKWFVKSNIGVPKTRNITINGVTQDLTADRTFTVSSGVTLTKKTITSANLTTQDVAGFLTYVNGVTSFAIASNEIVEYLVTDTGQIFRLEVNNRSVGSGQTALTSSDVLEIEPTFLKDFGVFSFDGFVMANGNLGYISQQSSISSTTGTVNYTGLGGSNWLGKRRLCNQITSAATAGSFSQLISSIPSMAIGNSNTVLEVFLASENATPISTVRSFSGIKGTITSIGNVDPSTLLQIIGIGNDSSDTNIQIMHNDNTGTATKIDLGASFPAKYNIGAHVYRAELHNFYGTANWLVKVECTVTGAKTSRLITTDLPAVVNTQMYPFCFMGNGSTATAVQMSFFSWIFKNY